VREAFERGHVSYSKVRAITRVATPATEEQLVELGLHASGAQLEKLVRGYAGALAATTATAQSAYERRFLTWVWEEGGSLSVRGRLPADQGALLVSALAAAAENHAEEDETARTRAADALVSLAQTQLAESHESSPTGGPADVCELVVHVDADSLAGDRITERAEIENGPVLAPETVRRLGCDAAVVEMLEREGQPLSVGRRTRKVPPALRRALRSRDDGCRFPGCTHRRFLHAHHIRHWARGGATSLQNLVQLCSYHHRLVHEGGFVVEHAGAGGLRFRRPDGAVIPLAPRPAVGADRQLERDHRRDGLAVDEWTCMPRSAGDRLDYGIAVEGLLIRELGPDP
jgi:hypothetical protein